LKRLTTGALLMAAGALGGCAYPDLRTAVATSIGSTTVLIEPPRQVPHKRSDAFKHNTFRFIPGSMIRPDNVIQASVGQSEKWGTKSLFCTVSPRLYRLSDLGPSTPVPDIKIEYQLAFTLQDLVTSLLQFRLDRVILAAAGDDVLRQQAANDLRLRRNDIAVIRSVTIEIKNIEMYEASPAQLAAARRRIIKTCGLPDLHLYRQISRIYAGDIRFSVALVDGVSLDAKVIAAGLNREFSYTQSGKSLFFAVQPTQSP
jgi:hypothetical protein